MKEKFEVEFTVTYKTSIECERADLPDEISNINIPEDANAKYVEDTFEVEVIRDSNCVVMNDAKYYPADEFNIRTLPSSVELNEHSAVRLIVNHEHLADDATFGPFANAICQCANDIDVAVLSFVQKEMGCPIEEVVQLAQAAYEAGYIELV